MPLVEGIIIRVTADGVEVVRDKFNKLGSSAQKTATSVSFLKKALLGFGAIFVIRGIINLSDEFTSLTNRVRIFTESQKGANFVIKELAEISNKTRVSIAASSEVYQRFRISAGQLGLSQRRLLDITESITKSVRISGATAQEATGALRQLSQAFSGNRLSGQELNSVLEQLPFVTQLIAKEMGIATGELRKLANEGAVTSKILIAAFENAKDEIEDKFGRVIPTVAESFVVLKNNLSLFVGEINKSTGTFSTLTTLILSAAESVKFITQSMQLFGIEFDILINNLLFDIGLFLSRVIGAFNGSVAAIESAWGDLGAILLASVVRGINATLSALEGMLDSTLAFFQTIGDVTINFVKINAAAFQQLGAAVQNSMTGNFEVAEQIASEAAFQMRKSFERSFGSFGKTFEDNLASLDAQDLFGTITEQAPKTLAEAGADAAAAFTTAFEQGSSFGIIDLAQENLIQLEKERARAIDDLAKVFADADEKITDSTEKGNKFFKGMSNGWNKVKEDVQAFALIGAQTIENVLDGMGDAFADFVTTGELSFSKLADSILADLTKVLAKILIIKSVEAVFGGNPFAGLAGGTPAPKGQAIGGFNQAGRPLMVGEGGRRELFVPQQNGTIINNTNTESIMAPPQVNLNVVNVTDPNEVASALNTPGGEKAVLNVLRKNRRSLRGL